MLPLQLLLRAKPEGAGLASVVGCYGGLVTTAAVEPQADHSHSYYCDVSVLINIGRQMVEIGLAHCIGMQ